MNRIDTLSLIYLISQYLISYILYSAGKAYIGFPRHGFSCCLIFQYRLSLHRLCKYSQFIISCFLLLLVLLLLCIPFPDSIRLRFGFCLFLHIPDFLILSLRFVQSRFHLYLIHFGSTGSIMNFSTLP